MPQQLKDLVKDLFEISKCKCLRQPKSRQCKSEYWTKVKSSLAMVKNCRARNQQVSCMPRSEGAGPESKGAGPRSEGAGPGSKGAGPESKGAGPESKGAGPGSCWATARILGHGQRINPRQRPKDPGPRYIPLL